MKDIEPNLKILSRYPENETEIFDYKTPFKINFGSKISVGSLIIKITDYISNQTIETIVPDSVILGDSSLSFKLKGQYTVNKNYSVLIEDGAIKYSDQKIPVIGLKNKTSWTFIATRILPEANILKADISGVYNYSFEVTGSKVLFKYDEPSNEITFDSRHPTTKHELFISFSLNSGNDNVYDLTSAYPFLSSYTVSFTEDYESTPAGRVKVLANNDNYFEAEFSFKGIVRNGTTVVDVSNGYIFYYKK